MENGTKYYRPSDFVSNFYGAGDYDGDGSLCHAKKASILYTAPDVHMADADNIILEMKQFVEFMCSISAHNSDPVGN